MNRRLILALVPAALALAAAAHAQPAGPGPHGPHGPPSAEMKSRHEAMQTRRLEDLKIVLRLRPDQEAALKAFVAAHHPQVVERRTSEGKTLTTPQRLEEMAKHEAAMASRHEAARQALAKFYAVLSPDQQKVFDALHRLQGHGPGGGRKMMHGAGRHRGGGGPHVFIQQRGHGPGHEPPPR